MKHRLAALLSLLWLLAWGQNTTALGQESTGRLIVSPDGPYTTIAAALAAAHDGDMIEVHGGTYQAPLVVEKSVYLEGISWPVIDGGGKGLVVSLGAPDITFRGFVVRGSGIEPDRNHAGITATAPGVLIENNRLEDVLFGIFLAESENSVVRGNDVTSKAEYDVGRKGDGIRLWYSPGVTVEGNSIHDTRDMVVWYSSDVVIRNNTIRNSRYGVHLMYCDGAEISGNHLLDNSVGIYVMYSNDVRLQRNLLRGQRGPSGYALGFKDADNITVTENVLVDNRAGAYLDGMPFSPQGFGHFEGNILAFNDAGIMMQPAVRGNVFSNNTFWENSSQVSIQGGGAVGANTWEGNTWSDYAGFDADGDGLGDVPYRAERFFESLTDREPRLQALAYSPAAQAIEFAGRSFPIIRPQPKLTDTMPRLQPLPIPAFARPAATSPWPTVAAAVGLLSIGVLGGVLATGYKRRTTLRRSTAAQGAQCRLDDNRPVTLPSRTQDQPQGRGGNNNKELPMSNSQSPIANRQFPIQVNSVSKRYGTVQALDEVSFAAKEGQALALWGENGAGKTTLLKAILGLIDFDGSLEIEGHDAKQAGKLARRRIGYVPQEAIFYDWPVQATMEFYAHLKGTGNLRPPSERIPALLTRLGLAEHADKPVPALSGGLKQRLALAIALLADPPVLLLDEPTTNLDAQARRDYLALLAGLRLEGKTIIFASHRLEEVLALADQVLLLEQGQLLEIIGPQALQVRLAPEVELTLWVAEGQRPAALVHLQQAGLATHLNGRGTVVVRVHNNQKVMPLQTLQSKGISVKDFEVE